MAGRADPYAPERSASELVAEYQRRYQKRRDERRTYNLAAGGMIAVLFVLAAAVVFWEYSNLKSGSSATYLNQANPTHEYDPLVLRMPDELDEDTWEHASVPNADTNVSGCSDSSRPELWVDHCSAFYDGKLYARGGATTAAMMKRLSRGTHAASLLELPDGTLLFAWFSGTSGEREGLAGVVIVVARLALGAQEWSEPVIVSAHEGRSNQNPVLFRDPATGSVWLFHTSQAGGQGQGTAFVASIHSTDGGQTWSAPKRYTNFPDAGPFVKGAFLVAPNGDWLLPMYYTPNGFADMATHYSVMMRTSDQGASWQESRMSQAGQYLAQPSVVKLQNGDLLAFYRDRRAEWIYTSVSTDEGRTWPTSHKRTKLPNNNSGIQALMLASGKTVLVFNNLQGLQRFPLSIAISEDAGETWPYVRDLEFGGHDFDLVEPRTDRVRYSYPSVMQTADGRIHVGYTYRRETMKYVVVDEAWIMADDGFTTGLFKGSGFKK